MKYGESADVVVGADGARAGALFCGGVYTWVNALFTDGATIG